MQPTAKSAPEASSRTGSAPDAQSVTVALQLRGVICDFRRPGVLRFGFTPLYTSFGDADRAAKALAELVLARGEA